MLRRRRQRVVRRHERDKQYPRLGPIFWRLLMQPDLRARRDLAVILGVGRFAGPGHARHLVGRAAHRQVVADKAHQIALAADDLHRNDRFRKSAVILIRAKVKLADRHDLVARIAQAVMPARYRAVIRIGVVPISDLMNVLAGGKGSPRGDADRRRRPAIGKAGSARRQRVEVGRAHQSVPVTTHQGAAVLVRHQDQQVFWLHCISPGHRDRDYCIV